MGLDHCHSHRCMGLVMCRIKVKRVILLKREARLSGHLRVCVRFGVPGGRSKALHVLICTYGSAS